MSLASEIKTMLDALGTLGTIVIGEMRPTPDVLGAIYEYGGLSPEHKFGVVGIGYERPSFQLCFRGAPNDYASPRAKAEIAWRALAAVQPGAIPSGTTEYLTIDPQQSPFSLGKDENNRYEIACNFWVVKEPS